MGMPFLTHALWMAAVLAIVHGPMEVAATPTFWISVPAGESVCFSDWLQAGSKMRLSFAVSDGGNHDINVRITGPDGKIVGYEKEQHDALMEVNAHMIGKYVYCFGNEMSSVTDKRLMFYVEQGEAPKKPGSEADDEQMRLSNMISELAAELSNVQAERQYMELRQDNHRELAESTHSKVLYWAALEGVMIVCMSVFQIYYLKRTFETTTAV